MASKTLRRYVFRMTQRPHVDRPRISTGLHPECRPATFLMKTSVGLKAPLLRRWQETCSWIRRDSRLTDCLPTRRNCYDKSYRKSDETRIHWIRKHGK